MAMSLTGKVHPYKQNFGPYAAEVYHVALPERVPRPDHGVQRSMRSPRCSRRRCHPTASPG